MVSRSAGTSDTIVHLRELLTTLSDKVDVQAAHARIAGLECELQQPELWTNHGRAAQVSSELAQLRSQVEGCEGLRARLNECDEMIGATRPGMHTWQFFFFCFVRDHDTVHVAPTLPQSWRWWRVTRRWLGSTSVSCRQWWCRRAR